jgi:hypothetical protein
MSLLHVLSWMRDDRLIEAAALEVARRCEGAVWERVAPRLAEMTSSEARGYVRARGALVVERQIELLRLTRPEIAANRSAVVEHSLNVVVNRVLDQYRARRFATPAPQAAAVRRAA